LPKPEQDILAVFSFFNEIGIINQLSSRLFETHLPEGFLISHFSVLNHLVRMGDGRTPLSIARALQVPKTSLSHTLSGLNTAGFITFEANPADHRSKCVKITDAGRRFRHQAITMLIPDLEKLRDTITPERFADSLPLLAEIRAYLDQKRDK
jgi:DNA-binding MarR family transcriptional regulator